MGLMRFLVPDRRRLADGVLQGIHMSGLDEIPWPSSVRWDGKVLVLESSVNASGNVHCPWRPTGQGELVLSTCSLMQRERPYVLDVEMARGVISQIRNHLAAWEPAGLAVPQTVIDDLAEANRAFSRAVALQREPAAAAAPAGRAVDAATGADVALGASYAEQAIAGRWRETAGLQTLLGVNLGPLPLGVAAATAIEGLFHMAVIPIPWHNTETKPGDRNWRIPDSQIAWCHRQGMRVCLGPLLQLDARGAPDWLNFWDGGFDNLMPLVLDHIQAVVTRYRGRVQVWQVAARMNVATALSFTEHERLEILVRAIEMVRELDPQTALTVTIDQPWAEYMASSQHGLAPFPFADALLRADLGVAGLGLEINSGYYPGGTMPRTVLALCRQLDRWGLLGTPLIVAVTAPSGDQDSGPGAAPQDQTKPPRRTLVRTQDVSEEYQHDWIMRQVPMMLAKHSVQVVVWNQLSDRDPQGFPGGGLLDASGRPKPALDALRSIRNAYLS